MADGNPESVRVTLVPPQADWASRAEAEASRLRGAIGDCLIRVEPIGSTSIPGLLAKPTLDLLPPVTNVTVPDTPPPSVPGLGLA